ncbi:MAG: OB-fold protein [Pseudomonas sp.]|uniref:OB-fold protein n=1 Tax=Pseudomonas sp. TaxID=306 RepID=UPI003D6FB36C
MSTKRFVGIILAAGIAFIVITGLINSPGSVMSSQRTLSPQDVVNAGREKRQKEAERIANLSSYSAHDIAAAYNRNTVAADQTFKGQQFKVSGTVVSINTDYRDRPYVTMKGGVNRFSDPHFTIVKEEENFAATLEPGSVVTLACTGKGDVAKTPMSGDCTFVW